MKVAFWGVRGSIPSPGVETCRYGGNTSCLLVEAPGEAPLVLDCGSGLRALGRDLVRQRPPQVLVFFTHFHIDHVIGLPFFGPLYSPTIQVELNVPALSEIEAESRLAGLMNGIYHPVRLRDFQDRLRIHAIRPGRTVERGGYRITPIRLNHPGHSYGYRVEAGGRSMALLTDTAPLARLDEGLVAQQPARGLEAKVVQAVAGCDLVVMDTMFGFDEYIEKMTWGHAYPEYAATLCRAAGARQLALFHHSPEASDDELDALGARWADHRDPRVFVAREGGSVDLEG